MAKKIVTIGGGSGQFILLSSLRDQLNIKITGIVSMVDSGGSTGRLRDEYGVLPPGDILKCILALAPNRNLARQILQKRFQANSRLKGHVVGNMLLTILSQYTFSFPKAVKALGEILHIKGQVLPVTICRATLTAELEDGSWLFGESAIDVPKSKKRAKILRTLLVPHHSDDIKVYPPVIKALERADYLFIGPGDLYTSITPNFLVKGVMEAITHSKAKKIYLCNIMTKFGETDNFKVSDFVTTIEKFIHCRLDIVIINSTKPSLQIIKKYQKEHSQLVKNDLSTFQPNFEIISHDLLNDKGGIIRHDYHKLADLIKRIIV